jgi:hypothetical protein
MFKKVAFGIIAGSLVLVTQAASADSTQFLIDGKYRGVSEIPSTAAASDAGTVRGAVAPKTVQLEKLQAGSTLTGNFPAPHNIGGGYFN